MVDYNRLKATADRLIKKFGKTTASNLVEPGTPSGDSWNPTVGPPTLHPCNLVMVSYSIRQTDGVRILIGDRRAIVAVGSIDTIPNPAWLVRTKMKGDNIVKDYRIIRCDPLEPGDVTLLWDIQCRAS